jgi:hypothetical protein
MFRIEALVCSSKARYLASADGTLFLASSPTSASMFCSGASLVLCWPVGPKAGSHSPGSKSDSSSLSLTYSKSSSLSPTVPMSESSIVSPSRLFGSIGSISSSTSAVCAPVPLRSAVACLSFVKQSLL